MGCGVRLVCLIGIDHNVVPLPGAARAERLSKKGPASGAGLKVDRVRHLKAPISPSPQTLSAAFGSTGEARPRRPLKREPRPTDLRSRASTGRGLFFWADTTGISRVSAPTRRLQKRPPHACGVVRNVCCDVSAGRGAVFNPSAAPLLPPKPAI